MPKKRGGDDVTRSDDVRERWNARLSRIRRRRRRLQSSEELLFARHQAASYEDYPVERPLTEPTRWTLGYLVRLSHRLEHAPPVGSLVLRREQHALCPQNLQPVSPARLALVALVRPRRTAVLPQELLEPRFELSDVDPSVRNQTRGANARVVHVRERAARVFLHPSRPESRRGRGSCQVAGERRSHARLAPRGRHRALVEDHAEIHDAAGGADDLRLGVDPRHEFRHALQIPLRDQVALVQHHRVGVRDL
mmetsp:Transcript_1509/g.6156  ORF Transcript_1509/g.6156 Transcript_1509/m.6156 type:complete len:251 (+) Transcript_1509:83-835(+)